MFDKEKREQQVAEYLSNKIKRCKKCGAELNYLEKFQSVERVCDKCKTGSQRLISQAAGVEAESLRQTSNDPYLEWRRMNALAEKKWREEHPTKLTEAPSHTPERSVNDEVSSERIYELIGDYDDGRHLDISQEELVSLLWEILYHRKIIT